MTMFSIEPVDLVIRLTVTKATANGLLGGVTNVEVTSANGEADARFYGFANKFGGLVLNFKADGRPAKKEPAAPKPLTAAQKAQIPANGTKGKAKAKPVAEAPAPAAAPDMAAIVAAVLAAMQK